MHSGKCDLLFTRLDFCNLRGSGRSHHSDHHHAFSLDANLYTIAKGFDEYMNLVLDDAVEIDQPARTSINLGRILLKGDTITMLTAAPR